MRKKSAFTRQKNSHFVIIGMILICLGSLTGLYLYFGRHYFWGTTINQIDVSGLSVQAATAKVKKETGSVDTALLEKGEKIQFTIPAPYTVDEKFLEKYIRCTAITLPVKKDVKNQLELIINALSFPDEQPSKNAKLTYKEGKVTIIPEKIGTSVDRTKLMKRIYQDLKKGNLATSYELKNFYKQPEITQQMLEDEKRIQRVKNLLNRQIKLKIDKKNQTITKKALFQLLDDKGDPDATKIQNWLEILNRKYSTLGEPVDFTTIHGKHLQYDNIGNYGWSIDTAASADKIVKNLGESTAKLDTIKLVLTGDPKLQPLHIKKDYLEVDLDQQRMYCFRKGKKIVDTPVITGQYTKGTATVPGFHMIMDRKRDVSLEGTLITGDGTYSVPVNYWLPLLSYGQTITGIGLHDTGHKEEHFGEKNAYKTELGSYGCINTPEAAVAKIYQNSYIGMPVFIYGHTYDEAPGIYDKPVFYGTELSH